MLTITQGPPTEMQVWVVCGILTFLTVAPLAIATAALCGWVVQKTRPAEPVATGLAEETVAGLFAHREVAAPAAPHHTRVGIAA